MKIQGNHNLTIRTNNGDVKNAKIVELDSWETWRNDGAIMYVVRLNMKASINLYEVMSHTTTAKLFIKGYNLGKVKGNLNKGITINKIKSVSYWLTEEQYTELLQFVGAEL